MYNLEAFKIQGKPRESTHKVVDGNMILIKKISLLLSLTLPIVSYLLFITIRDPRFVSNSLQGPNMIESEFFLVSQFCADIPMCLRVSSSYVGQLIYLIGNFLLTINPNYFNPHYPISYNEYKAFLNILSSFTFRVLIFIGIIVLLHLLFKDLRIVVLLSSLSFFFLSHFFHILFIELIFDNILQIQNTYMMPLKRIILMYLVYYDYINLLLSLSIVWIIAHLHILKRNYPLYSFFLLGFILTSFFEHLGILLTLSLLFWSFRNNRLKAFVTLLGSLFYIVIFIFYVNLNQSQLIPSGSLISTYLFYFNNNLQNIYQVFVQLFLMLVFPVLIGVLMSNMISKFKCHISINIDVINSFKSVLLAYLCIYFFGFFSSGIAWEFTRQALPFSFLSVIYFSIKKFSSESRFSK